MHLAKAREERFDARIIHSMAIEWVNFQLTYFVSNWKNYFAFGIGLNECCMNRFQPLAVFDSTVHSNPSSLGQ